MGWEHTHIERQDTHPQTETHTKTEARTHVTPHTQNTPIHRQNTHADVRGTSASNMCVVFTQLVNG